MLEVRIANLGKERLHVLLWHVQPLLWPIVRDAKRDQIHTRQPCLPAGGDKDQRRLVWAVRSNGSIGGLVHGRHPRAVVLPGKPLDMLRQRHRAHAGLEIEEPLAWNAEPGRQIMGVGQRRREAHNPHLHRRKVRCSPSARAHSGRQHHLVGRVCGDVVGARDNHLQHRASIPTQKMNLINDQKRHLSPKNNRSWRGLVGPPCLPPPPLVPVDPPCEHSRGFARSGKHHPISLGW